MANAQALALDHVLAGRCDVEQQIDQVILEQIGLVDIKKAAMRARQQPRLERLDALAQRAFEIERTDHAVLRGAERQIDDRDRRKFAFHRAPRAARSWHSAQPIRSRPDRSDSGTRPPRAFCGNRRRQRAHRGRLAGAAVAEYQNAADGRIDRRDQQRQLHLVLADDR